mgnify:CR=1 FL=1
MSETERLVRFELFGQEFKFYTAATEAEIDAILTLVREQVEGDLSERTGTLPASKIAVMACLNIASKYVQLKQDFETQKADNESRCYNLSEKIRNSLPQG